MKTEKVSRVFARIARILVAIVIIWLLVAPLKRSLAQESYRRKFTDYEVVSFDVDNNTCLVTDGTNNVTVSLLGVKLKNGFKAEEITRHYLGAKVYLVNDPNLPVKNEQGVRQSYIILDRNDEILQLHLMLDGFADFDCPRAADRYLAYRECFVLGTYPV